MPLSRFETRIIQYAEITKKPTLRKVTKARQGARTDNQELNRRPLGINITINYDTTKFGPAGYEDDESDDDDDNDNMITIKLMIEITFVMK